MMTENWINQIIHEDAKIGLRNLPDDSVHCILTSPPYYNQRDYSTPVQIGNEKSPEDYVHALDEVFRECLRVLREDGTLWLNLGDKYEDGELLAMPWQVAFALKREGWLLRSDIIWHKPNAMPSSVKTRPTTDHEYIFLFSKGQNYFYDIDAIREPHVTFSENSRMKGGRNHFGKVNGTPEQGKNQGNSNLHNGRWDQAFHPKGRNRRTVWEIPLSKFREAHFAVFPEKLVELCILAGCPEGGIVLDPFIGSGTTAVVAQRLGRKFVGMDSNPEYCEMARKRVSQLALL
ncbi:MAG TPA: site-specific DNA-methyltransferase [Anaerolineales bacterium]|nr:site-specific DNA-methyltransferase [Anaerolineales bacterium]